MQKIKELMLKYQSLIKYGIFGVITVGINLLLYKLFLYLKINYVIASIVSYIIASLISYYFNVFFVFKQKILKFSDEIIRIVKYFSVRVGSVVADTVLLICAVEFLKLDEFYSKIGISIVIILVTYIFNKLILKGNDK